ncbi:MAG: DNA cytosine methyltransferase [Oscillospiraceae bacterium]|nr:DNA cytosine methyltransferase [Oscillospiraceae bacterium]
MKKQFSGQISILDEIIVDNFAGGGGASTGMELATGRPVAIAINHDPAAILMHKTNHPYTEHLQASVWDVDPEEVCGGRPVGLAWFSPDCKHFSKAKGAALVDRNIRGLAWIVLRWAGTVRPRVIILENVEEFQTWGPVRKGKPVKSKSGQTFRRWWRQLLDLGYEIDHRELVAADYGAPTTRKRFYMVARCDGQPIKWPEKTHGPKDSLEVKSGKLLPWRSAAEIIDWSQPMYSIFASKQEIKEKYGATVVRPLAANTQRRVIRGVDKFTLKSGKPFLVPVGYGERSGQAPRVHNIEDPLPTVVSSGKHHLVEPVLAPATFPNTANSVGAPASQPVMTIRTGGGGGQILSAANLIQYHTEQTENVRANGMTEPLPTADASNRYGLISASLVEYFSTGRPLDIQEPMHTVTSHDREALQSVVLQPFHAGGYHGKGNLPTEPLNTITSAGGGGLSMSAAHVVEFKGQDVGQDARKPLRTITASAGEFAVAGTIIRKYQPDTDLGYWPEVRALLNKYCGYALAEDEIILLKIDGRYWYIHDIIMRMLTPRELYSAMGFPADYKIERDYNGKPYPKSQQVARCGNAVCPAMAEAIARANMPEMCGKKYQTMAALENDIAV